MEIRHYIFIDKKRLIAGQKNASKIIGSIKELVRQNILINDKIINYDSLCKLLGEKKYYNDSNYYIRRTIIERSKHK